VVVWYGSVGNKRGNDMGWGGAVCVVFERIKE